MSLLKVKVSIINGFYQESRVFIFCSMNVCKLVWLDITMQLWSMRVHKAAARASLASHSARQQWPPTSACQRITSDLNTNGHQFSCKASHAPDDENTE